MRADQHVRTVAGVLAQRRVVVARAGEQVEQVAVESHAIPFVPVALSQRMTASTRRAGPASPDGVDASTLSRSNGSVFEGRTLNQLPSGSETVSPSSSSISAPSANCDRTASIRAAVSSTVELISPDAL